MAQVHFEALIRGPIWKAESRKVCQVWRATGESQHECAQRQTDNLYLADTYRAVPACDSTKTIPIWHTPRLLWSGWETAGRRGAFPEEAAGCLWATELQDYRGAKMNVTKTTNVHWVAERELVSFQKPWSWWHGCGAEVDYPPEREHSYMSLRLTWPRFYPTLQPIEHGGMLCRRTQ